MKRTRTLAALLLGICTATSSGAVDGVVEINFVAVQAGGITPGDEPGFPATLSHSGSYRLTGDLLANSRGTRLVEITADRVSLDLNGFTIGACVGGGLCGLGNANLVEAFRSDVRISGGLVTGAGGICVWITGRADVHDLQLEGCGSGLVVGPDSRVADVTVAGSSGAGVALGRGSLLRDSVVTDSGGSAIDVTFSALVLDTVIRGNGGAFGSSGGGGVFTGGGYRGCVITENDGFNEVQPMNPLMRSLGQNLCGSDSICP